MPTKQISLEEAHLYCEQLNSLLSVMFDSNSQINKTTLYELTGLALDLSSKVRFFLEDEEKKQNG